MAFDLHFSHADELKENKAVIGTNRSGVKLPDPERGMAEVLSAQPFCTPVPMSSSCPSA